MDQVTLTIHPWGWDRPRGLFRPEGSSPGALTHSLLLSEALSVCLSVSSYLLPQQTCLFVAGLLFLPIQRVKNPVYCLGAFTIDTVSAVQSAVRNGKPVFEYTH